MGLMQSRGYRRWLGDIISRLEAEKNLLGSSWLGDIISRLR